MSCDVGATPRLEPRSFNKLDTERVGRPFAIPQDVDLGVITAANELFRCRSYSGVVAVCSDAVEKWPEDVELRLLLARSLLALRHDEEAQTQLNECLTLNPQCAEAYLCLGQLAMRRDELDAAETFLHEALSISSDNCAEAAEYLGIVRSLTQPSASADKLPAAAVAVGCPSPRRLRAHFGAYLVEIGVISPSQLEEALAYHDRKEMRIGQAIVSLGFASRPTIEWAAHAFHGLRHRFRRQVA